MYGTVRYGTVRYRTVPYGTVRCRTVYGAVVEGLRALYILFWVVCATVSIRVGTGGLHFVVFTIYVPFIQIKVYDQ